MRYLNKKLLCSILAIQFCISAFILSGCSNNINYADVNTDASGSFGMPGLSSSASYAYNKSSESYDYNNYEDYGANDYAGDTASNVEQVKNGRKLVRYVDISAKVENAFDGVRDIQQLVVQHGGYVSNVEQRIASSWRGNTSTIRTRVPFDRVDDFLEAFKGLTTNIENLQDTITDKTLEYNVSDYTAETLRVEREAYLELLESADAIEDVMRIKDRISAIEYEINYHEKVMNRIDDTVNYTEILITITDDLKTKVTFRDIVDYYYDADEFYGNLLTIFLAIPQVIVFMIPASIVILIVVTVFILAKRLGIKIAGTKYKTQREKRDELVTLAYQVMVRLIDNANKPTEATPEPNENTDKSSDTPPAE